MDVNGSYTPYCFTSRHSARFAIDSVFDCAAGRPSRRWGQPSARAARCARADAAAEIAQPIHDRRDDLTILLRERRDGVQLRHGLVVEHLKQLVVELRFYIERIGLHALGQLAGERFGRRGRIDRLLPRRLGLGGGLHVDHLRRDGHLLAGGRNLRRLVGRGWGGVQKLVDGGLLLGVARGFRKRLPLRRLRIGDGRELFRVSAHVTCDGAAEGLVVALRLPCIAVAFSAARAFSRRSTSSAYEAVFCARMSWVLPVLMLRSV